MFPLDTILHASDVAIWESIEGRYHMSRKKREETRERPWRRLAELCAVMTHDVRETILVELATAPRDAHWLADRQAVPLATLRRHLQALIAKHLVVAVANGKTRTYRLGDHARVVKLKDGVQLDLSTADGGHLTIKRPCSAGLG